MQRGADARCGGLEKLVQREGGSGLMEHHTQTEKCRSSTIDVLGGGTERERERERDVGRHMAIARGCH